MEFDERRYRPLSTVDLFDEAFDLYKRNFVLFLLIVSFVIVPTSILSDLFLNKWESSLGSQISAGASADNPIVMMSYFGDWLRVTAIASLVTFPPWTLVYAALTAAVAARYLDKKITVLEAFKQGMRRYVSALISSFIFQLLIVIGYFFVFLAFLTPDAAPVLVPLGIIVGGSITLVIVAKYPLFMGAVIGEKLGPLKAIIRSSALTKRDTGRVLWSIICMVLIDGAITLILEGVLELLTGGIVDSAYITVPALVANKQVAEVVAGSLASLLITPFSIIVVTLIYYDQRVRKEGFDMEVLAERLGYRPLAATSEAVYSPVLTPTGKKGKKR